MPNMQYLIAELFQTKYLAIKYQNTYMYTTSNLCNQQYRKRITPNLFTNYILSNTKLSGEYNHCKLWREI